MKVLIITNLFPNSQEPTRGMFNKQQFVELSKTCELEVVAPIPWHHFSKVPECETLDGIKVYHPRYFMTPKFGRALYGICYFLGILGKVKEIYKQFKFDCILATWAYPDAFAASLIAKKFRKPLVIKVHGSDINLSTLYLLRRKMIAYALRQCSKVISVSKALKQKIVNMGVSDEKIEVIPNGVDSDLFKPLDQIECRKKLNLPLDKKIVLYVGNFAHVKGVDVLIHAFGELVQKRNNTLLVLVGDGPLEKTLRDKAKALGIEHNVIFAGRNTHDTIRYYMNAADAYCLPSRNEGCPNVVLESIACGRPVVASRVGDLDEIMHSEELGILVDFGSPIVLAEALTKALEKKWDYGMIREKSLACSWQDNAKRLYSTLSDAVAPLNLKKNSMISNENIVYFGNDWDADNKTSSHHIAEQLAKHNRLLYVESSGLRSPKSSAHDLKRITQKIIKFFKGKKRISDSVYVFSPMLIPYHQFRFIRTLNQWILVSCLRSICQAIGFKNPIVWIVIPHMVNVVGKLQEKLVVYYCVDSFSSLPNVESNAVAMYDQELTKKADIIFTPSQPLYEEKKKINANTFLSPHGVDVEHFMKAQDTSLPIPKDMNRIKKPIIGFFGLIENWVDLKLIRHIAKAKPDYSLVFIGRVAQDINGLKNIPNVYFFGPRKYEELPAYAKAFDVALLPYVLNKQVYNANPIKLREYLASGKPVVSVTNPEIEKFREVVAIADNYENFVSCIEFSLKDNSEQKIKSRIDRITDSSWENRFKNISSIVTPYLEKENNKQ